MAIGKAGRGGSDSTRSHRYRASAAEGSGRRCTGQRARGISRRGLGTPTIERRIEDDLLTPQLKLDLEQRHFLLEGG